MGLSTIMSYHILSDFISERKEYSRIMIMIMYFIKTLFLSVFLGIQYKKIEGKRQ